MIVEYIRYTVDPAATDAFLAAYAAAGEILQRDPHCLAWELTQSEREPTRCTVRIEWDSAEGHLEGFRSSPAFADFLALVGPYVAAIDEMEHYRVRQSTMPESERARPTLYDWAGGRPALRRLMDAFYDRVEADDLLSGLFPGGVSEEHRDHVATWWSEVLGGPDAYTELGGYPRMLQHHVGLDITAEQRLRFVTLMSRGADDAELPGDPEFRAALMGYLEWGTRLAMANSETGAEVVREAPTPRWGWGVAPPYLG